MVIFFLKSDIRDCQRQLKLLRDNNTGTMQTQLLEVRKKMQRLLAQDDAYWKQRAKTHWYKDGDRNTKFFHRFSKKKGKPSDGNKVTDTQGMWEVAKNYFVDFFKNKIMLLLRS